MTSNAVEHQKHGAVYRMTINRAERRNAVTSDVIAGIREGIVAAHADPAVRAMVLTGAGDKAFCAGADLKPGQRFSYDHAKPGTDFVDMLRHVRTSTLPLVARVNGTCLAGGTGLLAMCDMAVAADHARFGMPEVRIGLFPMQIYVVLKERVNPIKLNEWCLTGETFDAEEARAGGLVNYVVPAAELDAKLDWLLARIVDKSPTAIRRGKYAMNAMNSMSFEQAAAYAESQIPTLAMTEDAVEGKRAFNEKRKPNWTGR